MSTDRSNPAPVRDPLEAILAAMPARIRREWEAQGRPVERYNDDPVQVRAQVRALRRDTWRASVPEMFADASLERLTPQQDPDGRVSGWLASGAEKLLLVGDIGTGKTYSAFAIANAAVAQPDPAWVMYHRVPDLIRDLQPSSGREERTYRFAVDCDLLFLDDFGAEMVTDWRLEQLWRIVDYRTANRKRMIITTNLPYDSNGFKDTPPSARPVTPNLVDLYGLRLVDRLIEGAVTVRYKGRSRRKAAPW